MNKIQLSVVWLMGIAICLVFFFTPKVYLEYRHNGVISIMNQYYPGCVTKLNWAFIIPSIVAILIIGGLLILTFKNKPSQSDTFAISRFGKYLLGSIILVVILGGIIIAVKSYSSYKEAEDVKKRISPSEIQFIGLELVPSYTEHFFDLIGRIQNNSSKYTLSLVKLEITMKLGDGVIVGQTTVNLSLDVPPGQLRSIKQDVYFSSLGVPTNDRGFRPIPAWEYRIIEIQGH